MKKELPKDIGDKFIEALMKVIEEKFDVNIDYKIVDQEAQQLLKGGQAMRLAKRIRRNKDTIKTVVVFYLMLIICTLIVINA